MIVRLSAFADEAGKTIDEQIKALKRNSIELIEVRSIDGKNVSAFTFEEAKRYNDIFAENGISVWSVGSPIGKVSAGVNMNDYIKKAEHVFDIAKIFGTDNVRAFSFIPSLLKGHNKENVLKKLPLLVNEAEKKGVNYCLENDYVLYGSTAERMALLLEKIPNMKMIYDPANFLVSGQNPDTTINMFVNKAYYFHMKDASGKKVVPAGFGDGKIAEIINRLDRDIVFSVEPHLNFFRGNKAYSQSEFAGKYNLKNKGDRFDCAVNAVKKLLVQNGFADKGTYFEKI